MSIILYFWVVTLFTQAETHAREGYDKFHHLTPLNQNKFLEEKTQACTLIFKDSQWTVKRNILLFYGGIKAMLSN